MMTIDLSKQARADAVASKRKGEKVRHLGTSGSWFLD
jgi:hypothetical protein